jgi:hypothetical protein
MPFYTEFAQLYKTVFTHDEVYNRKLLGLNNNEKFVLFMFIFCYDANDRGHSGIPNEMKINSTKFIDC